MVNELPENENVIENMYDHRNKIAIISFRYNIVHENYFYEMK